MMIILELGKPLFSDPFFVVCYNILISTSWTSSRSQTRETNVCWTAKLLFSLHLQVGLALFQVLLQAIRVQFHFAQGKLQFCQLQSFRFEVSSHRIGIWSFCGPQGSGDHLFCIPGNWQKRRLVSGLGMFGPVCSPCQIGLTMTYHWWGLKKREKVQQIRLRYDIYRRGYPLKSPLKGTFNVISQALWSPLLPLRVSVGFHGFPMEMISWYIMLTCFDQQKRDIIPTMPIDQ